MKKILNLIYTSDTHGHVFPVNYSKGKEECSGLLNMAGQIKKEENTLVLDGGDTLQGTPLSQYYIAHEKEYPFQPMAEAFNALGCDYFTLGNHDFNFGYDVLRNYLKAMKGQCLCANLTDRKGELPVKRETVHVMENGLRVGITGVVTDYVMVWEQPENLRWIQVTDVFEAARTACERLKKTCDICICIYHGGFEADLKTGQLLSDSGENIACRIAEELDFDILLTGHQHMEVEGMDIAGTWAVQPPANAGKLVRLRTEWRKEGENLRITTSSKLEQVGDFHEEEPYGKLLSLEKDTQKWLDEPVGELAQEIKPEGKLQAALNGSSVAAFFNEVQLAKTGADFSCTSLGNDPVGLKKNVTMRSICGAYLFANTLVVLEVDAEVIKASLERCAAYFTLKNGQPQISDEFLRPKIEHYNYDFYAGLSYEFDLRRPVGERVTKICWPDGRPLTERKYKLVTSNYRATGTGGYDLLGKCRVLWRGADEMPDLIAAYLEQHSPVSVSQNGEFMVKW